MKTSKEKYYSDKELFAEFNKLNNKQTVTVLYEALDYMKQYNGRSKATCVFMAMGYENTEGDKDTWTKKT